MEDYKQYLPYATDRQKEYVTALVKEKSVSKAAQSLAVNVRTMQRALKTLKANAAKKGFAPKHGLNKPAPDGFEVSTLRVNTNGDYVPAYAKLNNKENIDDLVERIVDAISSGIKPRKKVKAPKVVDSDLLNLYTLSDFHLGMLAWGKESGDDWDLEIAENVLLDSFTEMISRSPKAEKCCINLLGDFLHADAVEPLTPRGKNLLDVDSRYDKLVEIVIRLIVHIIETALKHHSQVHVIAAEGNHDEAGSIWVRHSTNALFRNEDRVTVETSPSPYYVLQHGGTFLGFHHGHLKKPAGLPLLFADRFHTIWGLTENRYVHVGHLHNYNVADYGGIVCIQHPTLSAKDSYASRHGYSAQRGCISHTYHKLHGEVSSITVRPSMLGNLQ